MRGISHAPIIRPATLADADPVLALGRQILSETPYFLREPEERAGSLADMKTIIHHYAKTPGWCMLHAWIDGIPVGEAVISGTGLNRTRHIGAVGVGVAKAYWGRGVGQALMRALEQEAVEMALERLSFTVFAENRRARDFYKRLGYREEGVLKASVRWAPTDAAERPRYSDEISMAKWIGAEPPVPLEDIG